MRTNQQTDSGSLCVWCLYLWSMILDFDMCVWCVHKCMQIMMHISIILDLDTCVYDVHTCVYDVHMCVRCAHMMCVWCVWYTYLWSWSLILVHACMMHVSKVIDPDTCVYHAGMYDEFWSSILGPYSCVMHECIMHVSIMRLKFCYGRTNERTYEPTDNVWCINLYADKSTNRSIILVPDPGACM